MEETTMADYERDSDYAFKIMFGTIIGLIVILFLVPLGANIIASEHVANAATDDISSLERDYNPSSLGFYIDPTEFNANITTNIDLNVNDSDIFNQINFEDLDDIENNSESNTSDVPETDEENNENYQDDDVDETENEDNGPSISEMRILSGSISTGSGVSDKSHCEVYVGSEFSGQNILISTLYSRDGQNLNNGKKVSKTVDSSGYVTLNAAESYEVYPSNCVVTIYDTNGNVLDSTSVSLATESGTQNF